MEKYSITGMSCAACQARVEKAVSKVPGVKECSVSLLTNSMGVEGNALPKDIIKAVVDAGYGAQIISQQGKNQQNLEADAEESLLENKEIPILKRRLISSLALLLVLMYVSMGHLMWNLPLPAWFSGNMLAVGLLELLLSSIILLINKKFFISGFKSLVHGAPNMDTLVALGSGISYIYSIIILFDSTNAVINGNVQKAMHHIHNLYFESAAMILTLITVGKLLEAVSKGKTTNALKSLMKLTPKTAIVLKDGIESEIPASQVVAGDIFVVYPGSNIPVDGIVENGTSAVNESSLTGESIPVDKNAGDKVSAGTINTNGNLVCRATRVGQDTTISQIIKMVSDAAATKAPVAKIADKVSGIFVPSVIGIALITFAVWMFCGAEFSFALTKAVTVLVVSCPCALGLATPVAIMVGNGVGAKNGILFKTSATLEIAGKTQIVAVDKTGTITTGKPKVVQCIPSDNTDEFFLLKTALALESKSEHPLAKAIVHFCNEKGIISSDVKDFIAVGGRGVKAELSDCDEPVTVYGGNLSFIKENCISVVTGELEKAVLELGNKGQTPLLFATAKKYLGCISVADSIKDESASAVSQLKNMGIHVVMLTGDNEVTAKVIAAQAGVDEVIAGVLPDEKADVISRLKQNGKVCMVGDGINDAPSLTTADTGIAIGAGADVALDAADVVLVKSRLDDVPAAIRLSRRTLKNIYENLFWAFFYNIILIPIAAGAYASMGINMNPMFGAAAMSISSFCVVMNALRLNLINLRKSKNDRKIKNNFLEAKMEKIYKVEGMMCGHCEAHVKEAVSAIKGVESVTASHETGEVKVISSKEIKSKDIEKAVTKAGYTFVQ